VLKFFGLPGTQKDVSGAVGGGGRCKGTTVCCTPKDQSIFAYNGERCAGLLNTTFTPVLVPAPCPPEPAPAKKSPEPEKKSPEPEKKPKRNLEQDPYNL
jgi:hypothetical protein